MEAISEYNPLLWPPELQLAKIHMRCVCPGKDNIQGIECPCCGRLQKIKTRNWLTRDIVKDFKSYGGGVPTYFELLKYCAVTLSILAIVVILFHIYILQKTCPLIKKNYESECQSFLVVFKLCDTRIIMKTLISNGMNLQANIFFGLELISFIYLIAVTIGMKVWMQRVNSKKIVREDKVYSYYSLMIKNIPKFYQINDVRKQLELIVPDAQICELFFVYEIAEFQTKFKKLFDLHFQVQYIKQSIASERGATRQQLHALIDQYGTLYQQIQVLKAKLFINNGRAIAVFNSIQQRNEVYKALKIGECSKFCFHTMKIVGQNTQKLHFFADKVAEPQQILWKYVGQSSDTKTWVRIKTTVIGFGFIIAAFLVLYFPIIKVDENNIQQRSPVSSVLSILISIILQVLAIIYRQVILYILPSRHPSSRQAESYFVVITTIVFHFFFYIIAPGTYFVIPLGHPRIPHNIKLKQLFAAVLMFLIMSVLVAFLDLRYRIFNSRRNKTMSSWTEWGKFCQARLHEEIRWPSFPIQFKLMVIFNIWSFNAFYIFQIPYLLFLFVIVILIIFFVDKKNIYKHYKMQVYQSTDLQISVQKDYIVMFLACVCCGYAVSAIYTWQYYMIGALFVISLLVNQLVDYQSKLKQSSTVDKTKTLAEVVKSQSNNPKQSLMHHLMQSDFKENVLVLDNLSSVSLGTSVLQYGYKEIYDSYLNQFKNKQILNLLKETYKQYKDPNYNVQADIQNVRRVTQLTRMSEIKIKQEEDSYKTQKVEDVDFNPNQ